MKLYRPFSTMNMPGSLRQKWSLALRDPGYWLLWVVNAFLFLVIIGEIKLP